jgi:hypothetical protein
MDITTENPSVDSAKAGNLTCEACGAEFTCNANKETCWCSDIELSPPTLQNLKAAYGSCICKRCLIQSEKILANPDAL